jgi:hypothetical protein
MQKVNKNGISPFPWIFVFSSQEIAVKNYCSDLKSDEGYRHGEKALAFTYMVMKQREVWPCFYAGLWALFWRSKAKQRVVLVCIYSRCFFYYLTRTVQCTLHISLSLKCVGMRAVKAQKMTNINRGKALVARAYFGMPERPHTEVSSGPWCSLSFYPQLA